jgi:hypothetical protein
MVTLNENAQALLEQNHNESKDDLLNSKVLKVCKGILSKVDILDEVRTLNPLCSLKMNHDKFLTYTIDRQTPYEIDASYKGISRTLQGFEVILLTTLVREVLKNKCLPLSLDHDGTLVYVRPGVDINNLQKELSDGIKDWSQYLLNGISIPVVAKLIVSDGTIIES